MSSADADVIVVGGGHNGLICAAYLARAGIDTLLVETRSSVGGCASTVSDLGARFNICNCDHTMIRALPVIDELDLASYGLEYLEPEAGSLNLFHDRSEPWVFFHETERTLDGLATSYPDQVSGYRRYLDDALPVAELIIAAARTPASAPRILSKIAAKRAHGAVRLLDWSRRSAAAVLADYFDDWRLTMPSISTGPTVWGVRPDTPGTGLAAASYAIRHLVKTGRPKGGSGALTDAIGRSFEAAGGRVEYKATVERLLLTDGAVRGVRLADQRKLTAPTVIAACDPHRVFTDWLEDVPRAASRLVDRWTSRPVAEGYESKIDAVLSELPRYLISDQVEAAFPGLDVLSPTAIISPSPEELDQAHVLRDQGQVAEHPTMLVSVPTVLDPDMQEGSDAHVLSLEVLFTPYSLVGGWPQSTEPQRWLDEWATFVKPGALDAITAWRAMTPDRYEAEFSMHRGHTPSYAGSPLAALRGQQRELTRYRTPIAGLYLSGAGTYPGAGVFGASGRNAADVVRRDLAGPVRRRVGALRRRVSAVRGMVPT